MRRQERTLEAADGGVGGDEHGEAGAEVRVEEEGDGGLAAVELRRARRRRGGHRGGAAATNGRNDGGEGKGKRPERQSAAGF